MPVKPKLKFIQIVSAQWSGSGDISHSIYGLTEDGKVYRYLRGEQAWEQLPDKEL